MALIVIVMILYLVSYFNVFLENFEFLSKTMFYPDSLFKEFLSSFTVFILLQLIFIFYGILYLFNNLICCHLCVNMSKEIHTKKSMAACSECRFICSSQYSLRRHQKIHAQGFSQHTSYKRKSKSYLFQNILMLFMFLLFFGHGHIYRNAIQKTFWIINQIYLIPSLCSCFVLAQIHQLTLITILGKLF